jgi:diguanylate cyclase (GGDEF)-like protein/PAS domain S-box-containing protein
VVTSQFVQVLVAAADGRIVTRSWWQGFLAVSVVAAGCYFLLPESGSLQAWMLVAVNLAALVALIAGVRTYRPDGAHVWWVLAAGQAVYVAAWLVWYVYPAATGATLPFPSVADVLYLVSYTISVLGLGLLIRRRTRGREVAELLDSAIITVGFGVVSWAFVIAPNMQDSTLGVLARCVSVAYPLLDVMMLAMAARLAVAGTPASPALGLLLMWITAQLTSDTFLALTLLQGNFRYGHPLSAGWLLSFGLLGAAALHPSMRTLATPRQVVASRRGRLLALAGATLLAPLVLAGRGMKNHEVDVVVVAVGAAVIALLVIARLGRLVEVLRRAEARLSLGEARLEEAQRLAQVGSWTVDMTTGDQAWSTELYRILGLDPATVAPCYETFLQMVHPDDRPRPMEEHGRLAAHGRSFRGPCRIIRPDGQQRVLETVGEVVQDAHGRPTRMLGAVQDVTDRQRDQENAARLASIVEGSRDAIMALSLDGVMVSWNAGAESLFGYAAAEMLGQPRERLLLPQVPDEWPLWREQLAAGGTIDDYETVRLHRDGRAIPVGLTVSPIRDRTGRVTGASVIIRDITERKLLEEQLTRQALYDPLTGLANRSLLRDRLLHALARAVATGERLALLFIDLDEFKMINDSRGHAVGDRLLAAVASRLESSVRPEDTVARLGGDEFAILLERVAEGGAVKAAERVLADLRGRFDLEGTGITVRASVGIAHYDGGGQDADELLRTADLAMYAAKRSGKGGYEVFAPSMQAALVERVELDADLRHALDADEFCLYYQPIVELATEQIAGFEALLRWRHPKRGLVAPDGFIPALERSGLIIPVGEWVLRNACARAAAWQARTGRMLSMSVNVSPRQLQDPNFVQQVGAALATAPLQPSSLVIEITEGVMVADADEAIAKLHALEALGVRIAVDDFGTGYSSLHYLQAMPVDSVKIDRSFIARIHAGHEQSALVRGIVKIGHELHLSVVAEGVETLEQVNHLRAIGCDYGQGFYFARPQHPESIEATLTPALLGLAI